MKKLDKSKILITSGPTIEMWDSVRYLSNMSTGKLGYHLAKEAREYGADVTLISSVKSNIIEGVKFIRVVSAIDMFEQVKRKFSNCDIFISAAAVCDYRPAKKKKGKIKKTEPIRTIKLIKNPDILNWAGKQNREQILVGFSLQDRMDKKEGLKKKKEKNCDIMVVNGTENLGAERRNFGLIYNNTWKEYNNLSLNKTAAVILEKCVEISKKP
ncbi:MAG: phosphopantothenoylcysteine decarboxylase [Atribacterota bacterium]